MADKLKIQVYLDNGNVYEYEVQGHGKAREHASAIVSTGYRTCKNTDPEAEGELEWFPPHRISKVKIKGMGVSTSYPDKQLGT